MLQVEVVAVDGIRMTQNRIELWDFVNINLLKPTGHVIHQQFNIQQL